MLKKQPELFSLKKRPRRLLDGESLLWDKICPWCAHQGLIFIWDREQSKYTDIRCINPDCKFGNK